MPSPQATAHYIEKYRNKANVVRQIHSNIAESKRRWDLRHTLTTIVLGAVLTFTGFMGTDRVFEVIVALMSADDSLELPPGNGRVGYASVLKPSNPSSTPSTGTHPIDVAAGSAGSPVSNLNGSSIAKKYFDFVFNGAALLLFIVSILNLIYRWKEDHTSHFQGVVKLTAYLNWLEEVKFLELRGVDLSTVKEIRNRYQAIVDSLPPNDEKDYRKAKESLVNKTELKARMVGHSTKSSSTGQNMNALFQELIKESPLLMMVLRALKTTDDNLWLGGGAIRNHVWDKLTGRVTPQDDFDVVYFDAQKTDPTLDTAIERDLSQKLSSAFRVSVKNQARMHLINREPQTNLLEEAVANWPETATSIAIRITDDDALEVISPYDVVDLLNLIVRPTPYHEVHRTSYDKRQAAKDWKKTWPELTVET